MGCRQLNFREKKYNTEEDNEKSSITGKIYVQYKKAKNDIILIKKG